METKRPHGSRGAAVHVHCVGRAKSQASGLPVYADLVSESEMTFRCAYRIWASVRWLQRSSSPHYLQSPVSAAYDNSTRKNDINRAATVKSLLEGGVHSTRYSAISAGSARSLSIAPSEYDSHTAFIPQIYRAKAECLCDKIWHSERECQQGMRDRAACQRGPHSPVLAFKLHTINTIQTSTPGHPIAETPHLPPATRVRAQARPAGFLHFLGSFCGAPLGQCVA